MISRCQQALRKNLFTNRSQLHPRSVANIANLEADSLINFLRNTELMGAFHTEPMGTFHPANTGQEHTELKGTSHTELMGTFHGDFLCRQGLGSQSVFALGRVHSEFIYSIVGNDLNVIELLSPFLSSMLEGFFTAREKLILDEQESFRMAFQMALDYSNSQTQAARQAVQDAVEASYRSVILAQENERRRISRELHDEAGQALIGLHMNLENLLKDSTPDQLSKRETVEKAITMTDNVFKGIRRMAYNLRPPMLDLMGINLAIKQLCREFADLTHRPVNYVGVELPTLADEYAITIYRVTQEALTNIQKYAEAKHIWVKLSLNQNKIELMIKDDGKGFDVNNIEKGIGLAGMQERLRLLNGEFNIESSRSKFTRINVVLPLIIKMS